MMAMTVICIVLLQLFSLLLRLLLLPSTLSLRLFECPMKEENVYGQKSEAMRFRSAGFPNGLIHSKDAGCNVTFKVRD